jgi:hypothetical protein
MLSIERMEALFGTLAFISAMLSVFLWRRAAAVPSFPDQLSLTLLWQSRLIARAGAAAAFAAFFLALLMTVEAIEAITGN